MQGEAKPKTYNINVFPDDHGQHPPCTLINNSIGLDESDQQHNTKGNTSQRIVSDIAKGITWVIARVLVRIGRTLSRIACCSSRSDMSQKKSQRKQNAG